MKLLCALFIALGCIHISAGEGLKCTLPAAENKVPWRDMENPCIKSMEAQVKMEILAAMTYMSMGAYFSQDSVNRPGFSKIFFESASEEREHAMKIIGYLLMRGELTEDVSNLIKFPEELPSTWESPLKALTNALELEVQVTNSIQNLIKTCESPKTDRNFNDYHLVDYLTGEFLDEQYKGQREIAGRISTLGKMVASQGTLGEFLFDKKLLKGEL